MFLRIIKAKYLHDYRIWLEFNNGISGEVDLKDELEGAVFGPLKNKENFKKFKVDETLRTIVWENGADLAPEFLHDHLMVSNSSVA